MDFLESRQLLTATVQVDQPDYAPGSTAHIYARNDGMGGSDFAIGETLQFQVARTDGQADYPNGNLPWRVTDGTGDFLPFQDADGIWVYPDEDGQADGSVQTSWYVEQQYANASLQLNATGLTSGAVATTDFTDSASITSIGAAQDTASSSRTTLATNVTAAVAVGKTVIVTVALKTTSTGTVTVADNATGGTNTYTKNVDIRNSSGVRLLVFSAPVARALAAGNTVTITTPSGITDKSMQVSSGNVVFESATTNTGSDIYPSSNGVTAPAVGVSYTMLGLSAAVTSGTATAYGNPGNPWYQFATYQTSPGTSNNTLLYEVSMPAVGAAGMSYPSSGLSTMAQLTVSGPWAGTIVAFKEVSPLSSTITYPVNGTSYSAGTWTGNVAGTAADSAGGTITQVKLSIRDITAARYFNGSSWVTTTSTQVTATGTTSWSYASLTSARLTQGHDYSITSIASGSNGTQIQGTVVTFTYADVTPPTVTLVIVTPPPSSYFLGAGSTLAITINFSESVNITGSPRLQLNTTPTAYATYASGTGSASLKFNYTVAAGQNSPRLDYTSDAALTLNGGTIKDLAGNNGNLTLMGDNVYYQNIVVDTTVPTVSSVTVAPSPTGVAPTVSASITDVNAAATSTIASTEYFVDTLGSAGTGTALTLSPTGSSTTTGSGTLAGFVALTDGTHTVYVRGKDAAGNWSSALSTTFVKDSALPSATLSAPASPTNLNPIPFTLTFSQAVTGLSAAGIAVTNGTVSSITGSLASYTVYVTPAGQGAVTCQVLAGAAENASTPGKFNTASNTASTTYDGIAPYVNSLSTTGQNAGAYMKAASSVGLYVYFSETIKFTGTPQLKLNTGVTLNYTGSSSNYLSFSYTVAAGQNAAPLDFANSALVGNITDAAGNAAVSPTTGAGGLLYAKNFTVDTTAPVPTVSAPAAATRTSPITFTITFPETMKASPLLTAANLTVTNGTKGTFSGSGTTYTLVVTPTAQGAVTCQVTSTNVVQDMAGNGNTVSNIASVSYDTVAPTVSASTTPAAPNGINGWFTSTVPVTISASDATSGVAAVYYSLDGGPAQVGASLVVGNGVHTVSYYAVDAAGNTAATQSLSVKVDAVAPSLTAGIVNGSRADAASRSQRSKVESVYISFSEAVAALTTAPITLMRYNSSTSAYVAATDVTISPLLSLDGKTLMVRFTGGTGTQGASLKDGRYRLMLQDGALRDMAGNRLPASNAATASSLVEFTRLFGDIDGNGTVTASDLSAIQASLGSTSSSANYRWYMDFDNDRDVDSLDYSQASARLNLSV